MTQKKQRVIVLMGGPSSEYEISLATGKNIIQSLDPERYVALPIIVTKERKWLMPPKLASLSDHIYSNVLKNIGIDERGLVALEEERAIAELEGVKPDVVFIAMHGEFGENGTVQGLFDAFDIPYTGSGVLASALGMDKPRAYAIFRDAGLMVPDFFVVSREEWARRGEDVLYQASNLFGYPLVVKPADRGSSVGVSIARDYVAIETGLVDAFRHSNRVLLQKFIRGTEVSVGVLEIDGELRALPPTEIVPKVGDFFDYHAKYHEEARDEITPARLPSDAIKRCQDSALMAHTAIGCSGFSRTDIILDQTGQLWVLEINTIPALTEVSILPQQAAAYGISFPRLLDTIIGSALRKKGF